MMVTQSTKDLDPKTLKKIAGAIYSHPGKNAAFRAWLKKLKNNETVPRGSFFRGKKPEPWMVFDEAWTVLRNDQ